MKAPQPINIELLDGKSARIGGITLGHVMEIEEQYGSLGAFLAAVQPKGGASALKLTDLIKALFVAIDNKADFADLKDFARHVPVAAAMELQSALVTQLTASMPKADKTGAGAGKGKAASGN